jgi:hypothetical protein
MSALTNFTKGMIIPIDGGGSPVIFQWNPATIKYSRAANWHSMRAAGNNEPFLQYTCGSSHIVHFSIDVSRSNNSDFFVRGFARDLVALADTGQSGGMVKRPSKVMFISGDSLSIYGVVDKVDVAYGLLANPDSLLPYEAKIAVTILRLSK